MTDVIRRDAELRSAALSGNEARGLAGEIIAGIDSPEDVAKAAWSSHPGIVMPITEQVKHDLHIAELLESQRGVLEEAYGPSLERLREKLGTPAYRPLTLISPLRTERA